MAVLIGNVQVGSPAYKKGIRSGSTLLSINGHEINDVLDYDFYSDCEKLHIIVLESGNNKKITV
ncbi:MAG: PDZ domain-containing protein, partial [Acutalibacteraceae bacterium]